VQHPACDAAEKETSSAPRAVRSNGDERRLLVACDPQETFGRVGLKKEGFCVTGDSARLFQRGNRLGLDLLPDLARSHPRMNGKMRLTNGDNDQPGL
jgi:hypothetical protein